MKRIKMNKNEAKKLAFEKAVELVCAASGRKKANLDTLGLKVRMIATDLEWYLLNRTSISDTDCHIE